MHSVFLYLLYWLATAAGIAVVGLVLIVEAFAVLALIGASRAAIPTEVNPVDKQAELNSKRV